MDNNFEQQPVTEKLIQDYMAYAKDEYGPRDNARLREIAELEIEDLKRKGCLLYGPFCIGCPAHNEKCPLNDWQARHPEFANDELQQKIKACYKKGE